MAEGRAVFGVGLVEGVVVEVVAFLGGWTWASSFVGTVGRVGTFLGAGGGICGWKLWFKSFGSCSW